MMSATGQTSGSRDIPAVRRVAVLEAAHMPHEYSTTPGGTVFSTTPGGTRIIYDRKFLLQCRTSPLACTPPKLPDIPGVTRPHKRESSEIWEPGMSESSHTEHSQHSEGAGEDAQFDMDI
ncbi:eukaryotic translation initiation factor 4E-binding protein 1-like [Hippocampus zosterae]|uniref:eukaryotic translation initiation factor 4E-binding protein 1-like n=1 Tax=Hippocampus zosterae TaxID=109293 RepID=UPI00223DEBFF|nr:eukaryotic translation initiation factor 4E-binding protein 1-like [Hippocampus zosterae]